jgi:multidrug efflux pump subunit AcrA (membrane-fusion protein)
VILPLRRPKTIEARGTELRRHEASAERNESNEIIGALIIEQIETDLPRELLAPRVDLVYEHTARALSNAVAHHSLFLLPVWRTLGKASVVVKARNLPKTIAALIALIVIVVVMFVVPVDFKLVSEGTIEPVIKRDVFVNVSGTVQEVLVQDKDEVQKGDVLVDTYNWELEDGLQKLRGQLLTTQQQVSTIRQKETAIRSEVDRVKLLSDVLALDQEVLSLRRQIGLKEKQIQDLKIRAPISGVVMLSWDVERSLMRRKLEPGQAIMSVADTTGDWELELLMPERRVGFVNSERKKALEKGEDLDVDYIMATDPRRRLHGKVKYVDQVTRVHDEAGHSVLIRANIDEKDIGNNLRPGAKIRARVACGRKSLGYYLFHEAIAWVQTRLLF